MSPVSVIKLLAACISTLLLVSCLDSREEVWINADASGAAKITITMPLSVASLHGGEYGVRKLITEYLKSAPAFTDYQLETSSVDGSLLVDLAFTFTNALDFLDASSGLDTEKLPTTATEMMGHTEIDFQGLNLNFKRRIELSKAIPGAIFFPRSQLDGHTLTTIIHLPKAATTHNASTTKDGGRTLIWNTSLEQAFKKPVETNFTMPLPIPWLTIGLIVALVAILITALIYYVFRRRTKIEHDQALF